MCNANAMIYDDYIDYTETYKQKYGERTLVLMEVGSFFEIYAIKNDTEVVGADIYHIADICNLQVSRKNKSVLENNRKNPLMAGFPSYALSKHSQTLLQHHYSIVLVEQVTPPPNPERRVTEILSPSIQVSPNSIEGNYLMVSAWDVYKDVLGKRHLSLGIAGMDISTGRTWVYEISRAAGSAIDEFTRCFQMYQPSEIVFIGAALTPDERGQVEDAVGVRMDSARLYHLLWDANVATFEKVSYQNEVLAKAFGEGIKGMIKPIEALSIENYENARLAFVYMIQFGYEHNAAAIKWLEFPSHLRFAGHCTLEYNSALQLQVISGAPFCAGGGSGGGVGGERPLLSLLNRCATAFGSRRFRERLLQPIADCGVLEKRYAEIAAMIGADGGIANRIHGHLKSVLDIERMCRRMTLGKFHPAEWSSFHSSLESIESACACAGNSGGAAEIMDKYVDIIDMDTASKYNLGEIKGNVFKPGTFPEIDEIQNTYTAAFAELEALAKSFEEGARVEYNEREGYSITMTKRRWETAKATDRIRFAAMAAAGAADIKIADFRAKAISASSSIVRVTHPWIEKRSDTILKSAVLMGEIVTREYKNFVATFAAAAKNAIFNLVNLVGELDITCTCARNAIDYHYCRPVVRAPAQKGERGAFIKGRDLRHPIIEIINTKCKYVANDIALGSAANVSERGASMNVSERDSGEHGLLLFGMNSSGKSSFMKAIGLNVIMAQAGMFAAASEFEFAPYNHIFTRISGADNIYRGWSSFTVEMMELKAILQRADSRSLVLGDELCSGTEAISALAIVAAGIDVLVKKVATFIFATHLHDLGKLEAIRECRAIYIAHMHVEVEKDTGILIFDRKLRQGIGSEMYGLEVCKGLGLPSDFLKKAHEIRCAITGVSPEFVATKISRYNSKVLVGECKLCGAAPASETHHINPQVLADAKGFIDFYHKNRESNLIAVCEKCHDAIHHGGLEVHGYEDTSAGVTLKTGRSAAAEPGRKDGNVSGVPDLYNSLRYNKAWYIKKTTRSKWKVATDEEAAAWLKRRGVGAGTAAAAGMDELRHTLFDPLM